MKKFIIIVAIFLAFFSCKSNEVVRQTPEESLGVTKEEYNKIISRVDLGEQSYKLNCAQCHTKMVDGKEVVPNFTEAQFELYKIRIMNTTHSKQLTNQNLSESDLNLISFYFQFKKYKEPISKK